MDLDAAIQFAASALSAGRLAEAETTCKSILAAERDSAVVLQLLGLIKHRKQQYDAAVKHLKRSVQLNPDQAVWHFNLGVSCRAAGKLEDARQAYMHAVRLDPAYASAHYNLGSVLIALGQADQALECFKTTLKLDPEHGNACFHAGALYRDAGNNGRALKMLRKAAQLLPDDEQVLLALAVVLIDAAELGEAKTLLEGLLREKPGSGEAATNLAAVYERMGEPGRAWELVEPLLGESEVGADAALVFADFAKKLGKEGRAIEALHDSLEQDDGAGDRQMLCHFALGRLYDERGQADEAFEHFEQGNGLKHRRFDPDEHEQYVEMILRAFDGGSLTRHERATNADGRPVFIVGMPRSGTSLVEQILATHEQVTGGGELPTVSNLARQLEHLTNGADGKRAYPDVITQAQLDEMAGIYLAQIERIDAGALRVTDKTPTNFLYLGLIARMLPGAKIIHCKRDPMAACWSCYTKNFVGSHAYSYNLEHLGLYHRQYQRLMTHWRRVLDVPMLEVEYERLVSEPETQMRQLIGFAGLEWSDVCLRFHENKRRAPSASYDQVRQPIYTNAIDHWRRYERHLGPLREALGRSAA